MRPRRCRRASSRQPSGADPIAAPFAFCLCADDYAMTPGVSRGILEGLEAGALSATSVMTTSRHWSASAAALTPFVGRADIGLHLNLTLGAPLGAMPSLAPEGTLPGIGSLLRWSRRAGLPRHEIAAEIDRQAERFEEVFGRPPDHVDGHQHVHILPQIRDLLFDALVRRGWYPLLRDSGDRPWRILRRGSCLRKAVGIAVLARGFAGTAARCGFATNDGFAGFSSFDPGSSYGAAFERFLKSPGRRHLVMCHPGHVDDELRRLDPVVETRPQELEFLLSPDFGALLKRHDARVARLADC